MQATQTALEHFYGLGRKDRDAGKYLTPAGPETDPYVRAYQDGWDSADRLRHVLPEDIIGKVPASLVVAVCGDAVDRLTGEGRR